MAWLVMHLPVPPWMCRAYRPPKSDIRTVNSCEQVSANTAQIRVYITIFVPSDVNAHRMGIYGLQLFAAVDSGAIPGRFGPNSDGPNVKLFYTLLISGCNHLL